MSARPEWLKVRFSREAVGEVAGLMSRYGLNTVCREANCPNRGECCAKRTATFLILGGNCTRNCRFCNIACGAPEAVDPEEPENVARAARELGLRHVVVTSVTRDDLPDGGAAHFARTIEVIRAMLPDATVEVLIPDLKGDPASLDIVLAARPDVLNHNVETVEALYAAVRPQAKYERSLAVLRYCKDAAPDVLTKTGFMVGLGETDGQIERLLDDVRTAGCDLLTIGQYLPPTKAHAPLHRYVSPEEFDRYRDLALAKGFRYVASAPLARSSYRAQEALEAARRPE